MEAEYIATCDAVKEGIWMKKFISKLEVVPSVELSIPLYCDKNKAIAHSKEPKFHQKSKHIERHFHLIWDIVAHCDVQL